MKHSHEALGKASILAIGTELTTGQITNRNAAWISEKLALLGAEVILHETVPDEHARILEALQNCEQHSQFIFVTGGLGPTSDDFTREVIAQWLKKPLIFNHNTWQLVRDRLSRIGIPEDRIAQSNRQQCFFPEGCTILPNPQGTAAGFTAPLPSHTTSMQKAVWVLPGPPHEVAAVWAQGIEEQILRLNPNLAKTILLRWQCLGKSEADLGEITEKALLGSNLKTGYRVHRPFVEVKVWCTEKEISQKQAWIHALDQALLPWVMTKQDEDLADGLLLKLHGFSEIQILDYASSGLLAARLGAQIKKQQHTPLLDKLTIISHWAPCMNPCEAAQVESSGEPDLLTLIFAGLGPDGNAAVGFHFGNQHFTQIIENPYKNAEFIERTRHFALEMALKIWSDWVRETSI